MRIGSLKNKRLLLIFFSILVLFISGEIIARWVLGLGTPPLSVIHPTIEYMFKPNQNVMRFHNHFIINQYGMRSEPFSETKEDKNQFRMMVFGDSVINGGNLTDHNQLATTILQKKLVDCFKKPVVVGNISAGSWGPGNYLAYVQEYGFFNADVIVLVISSHDYADNPTFEPLNPDTHPTEAPLLAISEAITRYLPRYLPWRNSTTNDVVEKNNKPTTASIDRGLKSLRGFLDLAIHSGAKVYVIQHWTQRELAQKKADEGNQMINRICIEKNLTCIQMDSFFENNEKRLNAFRDDIHPNAIGQEIIAKAIWQSLSLKCLN